MAIDISAEKSSLITGLKKAEGQLSSVRNMIEKNDDPKKIIQQLLAALGSVKSLFSIFLSIQIKKELKNKKVRESVIDGWIDLTRKLHK